MAEQLQLPDETNQIPPIQQIVQSDGSLLIFADPRYWSVQVTTTAGGATAHFRTKVTVVRNVGANTQMIGPAHSRETDLQ